MLDKQGDVPRGQKVGEAEMTVDEKRAPSLNHVCVWTDHGWEHITAEEAVKRGACGKVSAHSGHFICELCGQYVTLAQGAKYVPYFKHSAYEKSKNCPERTWGPDYVPHYEPNQYELPLRISNITKTGFKIQIGFLYVPAELLNSATVKHILITPHEIQRPNDKSGKSGQPYNYQYSRLNTDSITYLDVGCEPALRYTIECDEKLQPFWRNEVKGIIPEGSVFDGRTGKLLTEDADVELGKEYYVIRLGYCLTHADQLEITQVCECQCRSGTWRVYKVCAHAMTEHAAMFFLNLHCRLTETPAHLQPIWPLYRKFPYALQHNKDYLYFYMQGARKTILRTFPINPVRNYEVPNGAGKVARVGCAGRQQIIAMGQTNTLNYAYFWRKSLDEETPLPEIKVCDLRGMDVSPGEHTSIPYHSSLVITAPYKGEIIIRRRGTLICRRILKAETSTEINDLAFGEKISILQGLDVVYELSIVHPHVNGKSEIEKKILNELQSCSGQPVAISHILGSTAAKLTQYPQIRQWLYICIRRGNMPEDALRKLKGFLIDIT